MKNDTYSIIHVFAIRSVFHTIHNQLGNQLVTEVEPAYGLMTLGFGMYVVEAIIHWCLEQENDLEKFNHGKPKKGIDINE